MLMSCRYPIDKSTAEDYVLCRRGRLVVKLGRVAKVRFFLCLISPSPFCVSVFLLLSSPLFYSAHLDY
jgi:hypothetical protein